MGGKNGIEPHEVLLDWRKDWFNRGNGEKEWLRCYVDDYCVMEDFRPGDGIYEHLTTILSIMTPTFMEDGDYLRGFVLTKEEYLLLKGENHG